MKKLFCIILVLCTALSLAACGGKPQEAPAAGFQPALDTKTSCSITVAGSYDNFEALEAEFDRFNEYYPKRTAQLSEAGRLQQRAGHGAGEQGQAQHLLLLFLDDRE